MFSGLQWDVMDLIKTYWEHSLDILFISLSRSLSYISNFWHPLDYHWFKDIILRHFFAMASLSFAWLLQCHESLKNLTYMIPSLISCQYHNLISRRMRSAREYRLSLLLTCVAWNSSVPLRDFHGHSSGFPTKYFLQVPWKCIHIGTLPLVCLRSSVCQHERHKYNITPYSMLLCKAAVQLNE